MGHQQAQRHAPKAAGRVQGHRSGLDLSDGAGGRHPAELCGLPLIECTETRDQPKNKERALARLRTFIYDKEHQKYIDDIASRRKTMVSTGDRSAKIRTYNFPQGRVTDHRINLTLYKLDKIMNGDIQEIIDACIAADQSAKLAKMNE